MKFDEFSIGQTFKTKSFELTKEEMIRFSSEFDPQYMHIDEEKAYEGIFNGIIASGIHTMSISFKHWIELGVYGDDMIAGTSMNNIRFRKPVYPGDILQTIIKVIDKRAVKKEAGMITVGLSTYNQQSEIVFKGDMSALIKR